MENNSMPKILLVDDIKMFLEIQKNMLQALPVEVATATGGEEALGVVDEFAPDLIVLDANMPKMDGVDCCRLLKQHDRHSRIPVIMTVPNCSDNAALCREAGCDAILRKPLDTGIFLDAITCFIPVVERRDRRVELLTPVQVTMGRRVISGALLDISRSGACFEPDEVIATGTTVELSFTLPAADRPVIKMRAKVVRNGTTDLPGQLSGTGVAFIAGDGAPTRVPVDSAISVFVKSRSLKVPGFPSC